jgi:tripartite-type tricarboxylate transporter receptor subunit TctC
MGGEVQMTVLGSAALRQIRAGKVRALAVLSEERWRELPDVPTALETGIKDVVMLSWHGLLAPTGTPRQIINRLNAEWVKISAMEDTSMTMRKLGFEPVTGTPEQFAKHIEAETVRWARVIRESNIAAR